MCKFWIIFEGNAASVTLVRKVTITRASEQIGQENV
jgi:hypothetical protein